LYLEISHTCLIAGDLFVKPKELRHVPRTPFANFATNILRGYVFSTGELHFSKKSKAVYFSSTSLGLLFYF
jgi:hypothetical protein